MSVCKCLDKVTKERERLYESYRDGAKNFSKKIDECKLLRYQLALIIIPTIVGMWGFIGVIFAQFIAQNNPFFCLIDIEFGLLSTIFLIYVWRKRSFDLFGEEVNNISINCYFEIKIIEGHFLPLREIRSDWPIRNYLRRIQNDFSNRYNDVAEKIVIFNPEKKDTPAEEVFKRKLASDGSGLIDMDKKSKYCVILSVISSVFIWGYIILNYPNPAWYAQLASIFVISILIFGLYSIGKIHDFIESSELEESDIDEFLERINHPTKSRLNEFRNWLSLIGALCLSTVIVIILISIQHYQVFSNFAIYFGAILGIVVLFSSGMVFLLRPKYIIKKFKLDSC